MIEQFPSTGRFLRMIANTLRSIATKPNQGNKRAERPHKERRRKFWDEHPEIFLNEQ